MNNIPESDPFFRLRINYFSIDTIFYLVTRTRSTIIIKIIITINPVPWTIIFFKQIPYLLFFFVGKIQCLLIDRRAAHGIFSFKIRIRHHSQPIISFTFHKAQHKIRSIETEDTIIKNQVLPLCRIFVTNSRMTEQFIYLGSRRTSQQTHPYTILLSTNTPGSQY